MRQRRCRPQSDGACRHEQGQLLFCGAEHRGGLRPQQRRGSGVEWCELTEGMVFRGRGGRVKEVRALGEET